MPSSVIRPRGARQQRAPRAPRSRAARACIGRMRADCGESALVNVTQDHPTGCSSPPPKKTRQPAENAAGSGKARRSPRAFTRSRNHQSTRLIGLLHWQNKFIWLAVRTNVRRNENDQVSNDLCPLCRGFEPPFMAFRRGVEWSWSGAKKLWHARPRHEPSS